MSAMAEKSIAAAPSCRCEGATVVAGNPDAPVVALVGAPNAGKSTLFNALTGARVKMGNWPGTSVEVARGVWRAGETEYAVLDLPGTYSLDPLSPDEELTRELLLGHPADERPDVVLVAVDAASIARGLYLAAQVAEYPLRCIVVLTKSDVAAAHGAEYDATELSARLGIPVVEADPRRKEIAGLREAVDKQLAHRPAAAREAEGADELERADARFAWVDRAVAAATVRNEPRATLTDTVDRFALHPVAGPVLFLAAMWAVFQITTTVAAPLQDALDAFFTGPVTGVAEAILPDVAWLRGLVINGIIGGVGMVLTFVPLMALMFLCLAVLEDSGYMARAAVVADRLMRGIGLPGKAFIPLIVGFGCNVPAIAATRVLGDPRQRRMTALHLVLGAPDGLRHAGCDLLPAALGHGRVRHVRHLDSARHRRRAGHALHAVAHDGIRAAGSRVRARGIRLVVADRPADHRIRGQGGRHLQLGADLLR